MQDRIRFPDRVGVLHQTAANRWVIAIAAVIMQIALGAVYAWSVFRTPLEAVIFFLMPKVTSFAVFSLLSFIVLLCYGGGFGTMPAFAADYYGPKNIGPIYGLMLTAWGFGGAFGPLLIANIRQATGAYNQALYIIAGIMLVSAIVPFIVRPPASQATTP